MGQEWQISALCQQEVPHWAAVTIGKTSNNADNYIASQWIPVKLKIWSVKKPKNIMPKPQRNASLSFKYDKLTRLWRPLFNFIWRYTLIPRRINDACQWWLSRKDYWHLYYQLIDGTSLIENDFSWSSVDDCFTLVLDNCRLCRVRLIVCVIPKSKR